MELELPKGYTDTDIEKLMKKAFPDYEFSWSGEKSRPILGKHKGSEITQAMLKKNTFSAFAIRIKEYPDHSMSILRESTWTGSFFYLLLLITGIIPILVVLILLKFSLFKTKEIEFDRMILTNLKTKNVRNMKHP